MPTTIYNRFNPDKKWRDVLFRPNAGLQSAEMNEVQSVLRDRFDRLGLGIYSNGHVVENARLTVLTNPDSDGNNAKIEAGRIALLGTVVALPDTLLKIPLDDHVVIGLRHNISQIDELNDPTLRDPAIDTRGYQEPGALRTIEDVAWGWIADSQQTDGNGNWDDFFPVYEVTEGVVIIRQIPPDADPIVSIIAKYDYESNGNYIVRGFTTKFVDTVTEGMVDNNRFMIDAGAADIKGYKVERDSSSIIAIPKAPTVQPVVGEPHTYSGLLEGGSGETAPFTTIFLNKGPITDVSSVLASVQHTISLTKGLANGVDELPEDSIVSVLSVKVLGTPDVQYFQGQDWQLNGNTIDWSLGGNEPDTGTTMQVVFAYETEVTPETINTDSIVLKGLEAGNGLLPNQTLYVFYTYALPRKDLIVLDADGTIQVLTGISQTRNPTAPNPSGSQVGLATVYFDWANYPVVSTSVAVAVVPMDEIQRMRRQISDLYALQAISQLETQAALRSPVETLGLFVDAFIDDSNRDLGLAQNLVTANGALHLPVNAAAYHPANAGFTDLLQPWRQWLTLDFDLEVIVEQPAKTNSMLVNPYLWKAPPPPPPVPRINIADALVIEGNTGTKVVIFAVSLTVPTSNTVTVHYATANGTATAGSDYTAASGTLTFGPNETVKNLSVTIISDNVEEADEAFTMVLSSPTKGTLGDSVGTCLIVNDDVAPEVLPTLAISDLNIAEGNVGPGAFSSNFAAFSLFLSKASDVPVSVMVHTVAGTALPLGDYIPITTPVMVTFNPGETFKNIYVTIVGDTKYEVNKSFTVVLTSPVNATINKSTGTCTIIDDDNILIPPAVKVNPPVDHNPVETSGIPKPVIPVPVIQPPNKPPVVPPPVTPVRYVANGTQINLELKGFIPGETIISSALAGKGPGLMGLYELF